MHYCLHLFTRELPKEREIRSLLFPFSDEFVYRDDDKPIKYPAFTYDYYVIGGRYAGGLKLLVDKEDEKYNWRFYDKDGRNNRLYISSLLTEMREKSNHLWYSEEDYYNYMGFRDGFLYVDGAKISDIKKITEANCYCCLSDNGKAYARITWNGKDFIKDENFDTEYMDLLEEYKDGFLTIFDIHD